MIAFPPDALEVDTPRGRGRVWAVTQFGPQTEIVLLVILDGSGELWEFTPREIRATKNLTLGRDLSAPADATRRHP